MSETVLTYDYASRTVYLDAPGAYDPVGASLCAVHAGRLTPPVGWVTIDRRAARDSSNPWQVFEAS